MNIELQIHVNTQHLKIQSFFVLMCDLTKIAIKFGVYERSIISSLHD